jgi:diacylglycerol kinase (ATP)
MASPYKQTLRELDFLRHEQADAVRKLGKMREKIERGSLKVQVLEAEMARLEKQAAELGSSFGGEGSPPSRGLRQALLVINPLSGSFAQKAVSPERLVRMLRAHSVQAEVYLKTTGKAVRRQVRAAAAAGLGLVIVAGGDGTIEDVAYAIAGSQADLGILPTGTMNNLALSLGIPHDLEQACALIGAGITRQIDLGCIPAVPGAKHSCFLETAGLGLSIALPAGQAFKKGLWRKLPDNVRKLVDLTPAQIELTLDSGETIHTATKLVTISNAPLTGINNLVAPDAKMDDGLFDIGVYDGMPDLELARYFLSTAKNQRVSHPSVRFYRSRRVHIRAQKALPATTDKDELPALEEFLFEVRPGALSVIAGDGAALSWPVGGDTTRPAAAAP